MTCLWLCGHLCCQQMEVPCYPERVLANINERTDQLRREYKAFVKKLREFDHDCPVDPCRDRPYEIKRTHTVYSTAGMTITLPNITFIYQKCSLSFRWYKCKSDETLRIEWRCSKITSSSNFDVRFGGSLPQFVHPPSKQHHVDSVWVFRIRRRDDVMWSSRATSATNQWPSPNLSQEKFNRVVGKVWHCWRATFTSRFDRKRTGFDLRWFVERRGRITYWKLS